MNTLSLQRQFMTSSSSNTPFRPMKPIPKTAKIFLNSTEKLQGTNAEATFKINLPTEFTTQNLGLTMTNFIPSYPTGTEEGIVQVNMVGVNNPNSYSTSNQTTHRSLGIFELQSEGRPKEYPPAPMTGGTTTFSNLAYGNGMYTVSSASWLTSYWRVFDKSINFSSTVTNSYSSNTGVYIGANSITATNGSNYAGEWLKIQLPSAIQLTSYSVQASFDAAKYTTSWAMLGSSNNSTWELLDYQGQSNQVNFQVVNRSVNTSNLYNYFVFVPLIAGNSTFTSSRNYAMLTELRLYSLTKPQTGYTLTSSTYDTTSPVNAFDYNSNSYWRTGSQYNASTGVYTGSNFTNVDGSNMTGEWIELQTPEQIILQNYTITGDGNSNAVPNTFTLAVSSNGTNYTRVHTQSNINNWSAPWSMTFSNSNIPTSNTYNRFRILTHTVGNEGTGARTNVGIAEMRLNGYSNVANVGTLNTIFSIPPVAMTANSQTITGQAAGNGLYEISSSIVGNTTTMFDGLGGGSYLQQGGYDATTGWYTGVDTTPVVIGDTTSNMGGVWLQINAPCPVVVLQMDLQSYIPNTYAPSTISLVAANAGGQFTRIFTMCNLTNWGTGTDSVNRYFRTVWAPADSLPYSFNQPAFPTNPYQNWRLIVHRVGNSGTSGRDNVNIAELQLKGYASNVPYNAPPSAMTATSTTLSNASIGNGTYITTSSSNAIPAVFPLSRTGQCNLNAEIITTDKTLFNRPITISLSSPMGLDFSTMSNWSAELTVRELP